MPFDFQLQHIKLNSSLLKQNLVWTDLLNLLEEVVAVKRVSVPIFF